MTFTGAIGAACMLPLRLIITGQLQTPAIDAVLQIVGRETVLARVSKYL